MGPEERRRDICKNKNEAILETMITEPSDDSSKYKVAPFNFNVPSIVRKVQQQPKPAAQASSSTRQAPPPTTQVTVPTNNCHVLNVISNQEATLNSVNHILRQLTEEQAAQIADSTTNLNNSKNSILQDSKNMGSIYNCEVPE
ncbi:unnamed protein product [Mucor hiemalis]